MNEKVDLQKYEMREIRVTNRRTIDGGVRVELQEMKRKY